MLYLVQSVNNPFLFKFGHTSRSISTRLSELKTKYTTEFRMIAAYQGTLKDEQSIHNLLDSKQFIIRVRDTDFYVVRSVTALTDTIDDGLHKIYGLSTIDDNYNDPERDELIEAWAEATSVVRGKYDLLYEKLISGKNFNCVNVRELSNLTYN